MAITKTNFINYSRCPRYIALEEIKKEKYNADITYEEYKEEEKVSKINELVASMYDEVDGEEIDLIDVKNKQLEAMMKYYKQVEELAGKISTKYFKGISTYALDTKKQECFDFSQNGFKYLCYIDIYNESDREINIIEVKATTSKKYAELTYGKPRKEKYPMFEKKNNIYHLELIPQEEAEEEYEKKLNKLMNKYDSAGKYIYDLSVQRFIIENELKQSNNPNINKYNYYLAVLNHEYIYDGQSDYEVDEDGQEIITFINLNEITKMMQPIIKQDADRIERYLKENNAKEYPLGKYCEYKKQTQCKYFKEICGSCIPAYNSSLNYMENGAGFKDECDVRHKSLDLINEGYINLLDIPENWITRKNHHIQRDVLRTEIPYVNKEKLKLGLDQLEYPIYHLDFETFPCPIPRFKGETPYTQSPFEFSLHIENEPGVCDKEKDNYVFLAKSFDDEREELVKDLIKYINPDKGTLFAQNVPFEKSRIKELAIIFPKYKIELMKIYDRGFDLIWLLKTSSSLYKELGYEDEDAKTVNYYNHKFSGSYSIKKTLPVFSDLSYSDLVVKNGTEAIVEYANYPTMSKEEFELKYTALVEYCKQDTWAMVVILKGLQKLVK